jgi:ribosome recycling factor
MKNNQDIIEKFKQEFEKVLDFFKKELQMIRTGKANPALVENILVDYYGSRIQLKQLAAISCPEPRQILIQPWDKSSIEAIEKALSQANLGTLPVIDKEVIRINLPPLTEEFRRNLATQVGRKKEEAREAIRKWRDEASKEIQEMFQNKEISEDEKFKKKEELQKLVDEYNKKLDEVEERKRKEILE